ARSAGQDSRWYDGAWKVTSFARDGQEVPPLITDSTRWKRIKLAASEDKIYVRWGYMDDSVSDYYVGTIDETAHTITLAPLLKETPREPPPLFKYVHVDRGHVKLEYQRGAVAIVMQLERFEARDTVLMSRGFHWINEIPFSR